MYEIIFYEDENGYSDIAKYIKELEYKSKLNKESRINFNKILRPLKNRFLYVYYKDNKFVVLHYFFKKTKKTPKKELEQAKRKLKNFMERNK